MECNCNDTTNKTKAEIRHVYGNVLRLAIPLTLRSLAKDGDTIVATDTDFVPSSAYPVNVVFSRGNKALPIQATMDENVAVMEDMGTIPVGTYDITVECRDDAGLPYRFKQRTVLQVVEYTADAGIEQEIEYEAKTWYLDASIFLATTEIGSVEAEIDARLATVIGDADYDAQNKRFVYFNKDRSAIIATVDATPFVRDGMVENFYLDTSRNVLVIVLNSDGGRRTMTVPLYMAFADYYTRAEVNSRISEEVDAAIRDIDIDTTTLMTLAEYTYRVEYPDASVNIKYGVLPPTAVDFIEDIGEAGSLSGGEVFATTNGHIREASYFGNTFDLGLVTKQAILNKADGLFYRYDSINGWVQVGGSGSGGGEGTVTAVKMNNGQPIEPNAQGVVDLGTVITQHQDISGKANSADLATVATSGSYDDLTNKPTIPDTSGLATKTELQQGLGTKQDTLTFDNTPTAGSNNPVKSSGIKTYVDGKATITGITTSQDGTFTITQSDGNSFTVDLNHTHPQYLTEHQSLSGYAKFVLCQDEAEYNALSTKDSSTLYLIPES